MRHLISGGEASKRRLFRRDAETNTRDACATQALLARRRDLSVPGASLQNGSSIFTIEFRNKTCANFCWANRFTLVGVGAIAKTFRIHLTHHFHCARNSLWGAL